ncbi:hypothetical protein [Leucobacter salsicius]|uniref:hypothetical protein n=1 Tax=Leucobacter salsicius TaxID=664638 RepID=UPI0003495AB2|nr:hypothetical protein [Leucobacter salsicius]
MSSLTTTAAALIVSTSLALGGVMPAAFGGPAPMSSAPASAPVAAPTADGEDLIVVSYIQEPWVEEAPEQAILHLPEIEGVIYERVSGSNSNGASLISYDFYVEASAAPGYILNPDLLGDGETAVPFYLSGSYESDYYLIEIEEPEVPTAYGPSWDDVVFGPQDGFSFEEVSMDQDYDSMTGAPIYRFEALAVAAPGSMFYGGIKEKPYVFFFSPEVINVHEPLLDFDFVNLDRETGAATVRAVMTLTNDNRITWLVPGWEEIAPNIFSQERTKDYRLGGFSFSASIQAVHDKSVFLYGNDTAIDMDGYLQMPLNFYEAFVCTFDDGSIGMPDEQGGCTPPVTTDPEEPTTDPDPETPVIPEPEDPETPVTPEDPETPEKPEPEEPKKSKNPGGPSIEDGTPGKTTTRTFTPAEDTPAEDTPDELTQTGSEVSPLLIGAAGVMLFGGALGLGGVAAARRRNADV